MGPVIEFGKKYPRKFINMEYHQISLTYEMPLLNDLWFFWSFKSVEQWLCSCWESQIERSKSRQNVNLINEEKSGFSEVVMKQDPMTKPAVSC